MDYLIWREEIADQYFSIVSRSDGEDDNLTGSYDASLEKVKEILIKKGVPENLIRIEV